MSKYTLTLTARQAAEISSADVLDGWKLVPVEPTETMLEEIHLVKEFTHKAMSVRYKAMLDAAPEPPIKGSPA